MNMARLKVLNINEINSLLDKGYLIKHDPISAKFYMRDTVNHINLGAVRFDTYLKLLRENRIKQIKISYWLYEFYAKVT